MIKTSRSRFEIRQDPDTTAAVAGLALVCFGAVEMVFMFGLAFSAWALSKPAPLLIPAIRFVLGAAFAAAGWLFLRGRSRVVIDREHRMVARYLGVGGYSVGGNATWDLEEFQAVILSTRERRRLFVGATRRAFVVCLRRRDGGDLELYWARDAEDGDRAALSAAEFAGLPYVQG